MIKKILLICTIIPVFFSVSGCGNDNEEKKDETPKLSEESKAQIDALCDRDINCERETSKEECVDRYSSLYLKIKQECTTSFMKLQECALSLSCDELDTLVGCEGYRTTYMTCDGLTPINEPRPL